MMAPINTKVVRRSAAFLDYGKSFGYKEYFAGNFLSCLSLTVGVIVLFIVLQLRFVRK